MTAEGREGKPKTRCDCGYKLAPNGCLNKECANYRGYESPNCAACEGPDRLRMCLDPKCARYFNVTETPRLYADNEWVLLRSTDEDGPPDEIARVLEDGYEGDGMYCVCVPRPLRDDPRNDVDGLREVHEDDMRRLPGEQTYWSSFEDAVTAYVGCATVGDVRCDSSGPPEVCIWCRGRGTVGYGDSCGCKNGRTPGKPYRGWWFFPEDGRVDPFELVPRHAQVKDIKAVCLANLKNRYGWEP